MSTIELHHFEDGTSTLRAKPAIDGQIDGRLALAEEQAPGQEFSLPPVDGGKQAWFFLAAAFALEALVWGFPFSFGVFQDYYSSHDPFAGSNNIAIIGTCAMGIMYLDAPLIIAFLRRFPRQGRWLPIIGLVTLCLSLALSSFSLTVTHLIVTQGILYAIGGSVCYCPCILYMDEWFVKKKGLAYGIMWSGTGLAGALLPLLLEHLLSTYGYQTTLRLWASLVFALTAPLVYFIKPRIPVSQATSARSLDLRFALTRPFLLHQLANVVEAVGFFLPGIYLPSYARTALGVPPFQSALTVLLLNVVSVFGCVAMGSLIDRLHVTTCLLISSAGAAAAVFLFWGLATSFPVLCLFSVLYGFFAGSYTSTWTGIMRDLSRKGLDGVAGQESAGHAGAAFDPGMIFALLAAGRGIGNVASGPLSEVITKGMPWKGAAAAGYGSGFGVLIVFTGVSAMLGGGTFIWRRVGLL